MSPIAGARRCLILGAGGHAKVVIEAVRAAGLAEIVGVVDPAPSAIRVLGVPIIGRDEDLPRLRAEGITEAVVALGSNALRLRIGTTLRSFGYGLPAVVHPSAFLAPSAHIADGAVVMARAVVGTETSVGLLAIVNTGTVIDHDGVIDEAAHVAPGCALAGNVVVGPRALVGVGSAVRPGIRIGADAAVGAGSAVVADVAPGSTVGGAPARPLKGRARP